MTSDKDLVAAYKKDQAARIKLYAELERERDMLNEVNERGRRTNALLESRNARLVAALERIDDWAKAYPLRVFPEPDFKKVAVVLKEHGMTLDAVAASNMRHVVEGVAEIARAALKENGGTDGD